MTTVIGVVANVMDFSPIWWCEQADLFSKFKLDVRVDVTNSVDELSAGVRSGRFLVGFGTPEAVIAGKDDDSHALVMVGGLTSRPMLNVVGAPGVRTLRDLEGRNVGASSAREGTALLMLDILSRAGVPVAAIRLDPVGVGAVRLDALKRGVIAGGVLNVPVPYDPKAEGLTVLADVADAVPDYQFVSANVLRSTMRSDIGRATTQTILGTIAAAVEEIYKPANSRRMTTMVEARMKVDRHAADRGWQEFLERHPIPDDLRVQGPALDRTIATMRQAGTLADDHVVNLRGIYDESLLPAV